ncbi:hypothetical protein J8273_0463 [Carpediemonas membranifera]|uniref:Uncharacterized protein n=1 Tax=Carpediemonas membranifera TaxID=201153 RepID=A0A8J6E2Y2_9EUKA|nr:hypothetical protein J8273_0463 [Carpediemonas membranifera]|eukprot:KAG9395243.1 hypothetical protein J8273_0463 [Carpediemonas membranifera]
MRNGWLREPQKGQERRPPDSKAEINAALVIQRFVRCQFDRLIFRQIAAIVHTLEGTKSKQNLIKHLDPHFLEIHDPAIFDVTITIRLTGVRGAPLWPPQPVYRLAYTKGARAVLPTPEAPPRLILPIRSPVSSPVPVGPTSPGGRWRPVFPEHMLAIDRLLENGMAPDSRHGAAILKRIARRERQAIDSTRTLAQTQREKQERMLERRQARIRSELDGLRATFTAADTLNSADLPAAEFPADIGGQQEEGIVAWVDGLESDFTPGQSPWTATGTLPSVGEGIPMSFEPMDELLDNTGTPANTGNTKPGGGKLLPTPTSQTLPRTPGGGMGEGVDVDGLVDWTMDLDVPRSISPGGGWGLSSL